MAHRRFSVRFPFLFLVLTAACIAVLSAPVSVSAEEPELIKGTVKELQAGILLLKDVSFQDETIPKKDIKVIWDKGTTFFHGTKQVPKEEVTRDCRVLVKCTLVGSERKALLVRIIGGKVQ